MTKPDILDRRGCYSEVANVNDDNPDELADWAPVVLASARTSLRGYLEPALKLDARLARIVLSAKEAPLAQLRLAWWRDELLRARSTSDALPPDPLLATLLTRWHSHTSELAPLVDGWEEIIGIPDLGPSSQEGFERGRADLFAAIARLSGLPGYAQVAAIHGTVWARADFANLARQDLQHPVNLPRLPSELRALAVIGGLSARALRRGGKPIFGDRLSPLVALRLGIFGT